MCDNEAMKGRSGLSTVLDSLRDEMPELAERFNVSELAVFGSSALGQASAGSDIDILVKFKKKPGLLEFMALEQHLSDRLGRRVDLVMEGALRPRLRRKILDQAVAI